MTPAWAQRQEALLRDCVVFPDVFTPMVDRLRDFIRSYQYALETEAGKRNVGIVSDALFFEEFRASFIVQIIVC
jgi:hypothetical protein